MVKFVTIKRFSSVSGYSEDAVRSKIRDGIWREGLEWKKAPDGRILIDTEGFEKWVETTEVSVLHHPAASRSRSSTKASGAGRKSSSSPPPLI